MKLIIRESLRSAGAVIVILALLQPYGIDLLKEDRLMFFACEFSIIFLSSLIALLLTKYIFKLSLEKCETKAQLYKTLATYHLINLPMLSLFLLSFHAWFYKGMLADKIYSGMVLFTWENYGYMNLEVFFVSCLLYVFHAYKFRNDRLLMELEEVKSINQLLEKRQESLSNNELEKESEGAETEKCQLVGNTKSSVLEVIPEDIVYVESMANYADICYMDGDVVSHKTLRITMKQIQQALSNVECIVSPHRAFLVNLNFVVAISGQASNYNLQMFGMDKVIPVSRSNTRNIKERLSAA